VTSAAETQTFVMPSFVGQTLGSVSQTLQDSGFKLGNVTVAAPESPAVNDANAAPVQETPPPAQPTPSSVIVSQTPGAGQRVVSGSVVNLEVR